MGFKTIFLEGMKERRRKKALGKERKELKEKENILDRQVTVLGQKAWQAGVNIDAHAETKKALAESQKKQQELNGRSAELQKRKQVAEETRKRENERLDAARLEVEDKKRGVDKRLGEERSALKTLQKEAEQTSARIACVPREREQLGAKAAAAAVSEAEKTDVQARLATLASEESELQLKITEKSDEIRKRSEAAVPIQEESNQLQKRIEEIRAEQKKTIGELDQTLAGLKKELDDCGASLKDADKAQQANFRQLGEKLVAADSADGALVAELAAVRDAKQAVTGVRMQMDGLEQQKTDGATSAYKKMVAIIVTGVVLLVVAIVVLAVVLSPKKRTPTFFEALSGQGGGQANLQEAARQMAQGFSGIRQESEKIQGGKIEVADERLLSSVLPQLGGWQMAAPAYSKGAFGELETAHLEAAYNGTDGARVEVKVTDAGTASALLAPVKMIFALNMTLEDESTYQKVTTYNNIPVAERFDKRNQEASFGFIVKDRFLLELETKSPKGLELLREFVKKMDFSKLK